MRYVPRQAALDTSDAVNKDEYEKGPNREDRYRKQYIQQYGGMKGFFVYLIFDFFEPDKGQHSHQGTESNKKYAEHR